ncbi:Glutamate receptor 2.8 [Morella rubra]|uniref:Glutamate receptor 2.8 n=1 Tax=Morella rubra TaxID=262757 RepID=A0A6A1WFM8_9ROSI|nr:Glutamate receptor 2.8 [Morella rubra]
MIAAPTLFPLPPILPYTRYNHLLPSRTQAFPKGSPLVADVSRAILNITEGDQMKEIEDAWLGIQTNCPNSDTPVSSGKLSLLASEGYSLSPGLLPL